MTTPRFERFLASLYTDEALRRRFLAEPRATACAEGLAPHEIDALAGIDVTGLELAARSYAAKRGAVGPRKRSRLAALRTLIGV